MTSILRTLAKASCGVAGRLPAVAVLLAVLVTSAYEPAAARQQQAPNSRVVLELPDGYVPSTQFSGFQHEAHGSSFVILEVPAKAYDELAGGMTSDKLATRGIRDVARGKLARTDEHVFMRGRQSSAAGDFVKFFVVFKAADMAVLVSANVPAAAIIDGTVKSEEIERVLASAATTDKRSVRELFRLGHLGPFKEAGTFVGTSKIYTLDGRMEPERKGEPRAVFIVAPSLDLRPVDDLADFAAKLLQTITGYVELKTGEPRRSTVAGLAAVLIDAEAKDAKEGRPMRLHQAVLAGKGGGYFRLIGITPADDAARLMPEFKRMIESFRLAD